VKVISSLWGECVTIDELEVYLSADGHSRAAIARRGDNLYWIYRHRVLPDGWRTIPAELLYQDREPEVGIFGTLEDARHEIRSFVGMAGTVRS
jgi:hypothetical protein